MAEIQEKNIGKLRVENPYLVGMTEGVDSSKVFFRPIPEETIEEIVQEGSIFKNAGGFSVKNPLIAPFVDHIEEPYVRVKIVTPKDYVGGIMQLAEEKRAVYQNTEYLDDHRVIVVYEMPLFSIIIDFYDSLKSVSSGYASFQYELIEYRTADVVRMDMLVAEEPVEAFSLLVYRDEAEGVGRRIAKKLKDAIPRKQFEIKLQARVGGRIVASERIPSMRKDVLAKLYGGDVTRKMKLLKKQKEGKKRMKAHGRGEVEIPPKAYLAVLKRD